MSNDKKSLKLTPEEKELWLLGDDRWLQLFNARLAQGATDNAVYVHPTESNLEEVVVRSQAPTIAESISRTVKKDWNSRDIHGKIDMLTSTLGFIPGVGDVADFVDAGNQFAQGNYGWGAVSLASGLIPFVPASAFRAGVKGLGKVYKSFNDFNSKIKNYIDRFKNRKLRMTHTTTMSDDQKSVSKGDYSLITPSWAIYKNNGHNLFMYNKEKSPVIFIGNREIISSPNYVQLKGDLGLAMLDHILVDFNKSNYDIANEYVLTFGDDIRRRGHPFESTRKNLNYVKYNEGKYLGELSYNKTSYVIGPDTEEFKGIFKNQNYITYPLDWGKLNRDDFRSHLLDLVEQLYKNNKSIRLRLGGKLIKKNKLCQR